jgi:hypothetical protein
MKTKMVKLTSTVLIFAVENAQEPAVVLLVYKQNIYSKFQRCYNVILFY